MVRVRMLPEQFLKKCIPFHRIFRLVKIHHRFKVLGLFLVEPKDFHKLGNHAPGKLFPFDDVVIITASLGESEQRTHSSPSKFRVRLHACRLVFVQVLAEVCKLKYVNCFFHVLNVLNF